MMFINATVLAVSSVGGRYRSKKPDGKFYTNSVPFSCCSFDSKGPCIHDDVFKTRGRYGYNPDMKLTINTGGCSAVVSDTLQTTLIGIVFVGLSVVAVSNSNSKYASNEKAFKSLFHA